MVRGSMRLAPPSELLGGAVPAITAVLTASASTVADDVVGSGPAPGAESAIGAPVSVVRAIRRSTSRASGRRASSTPSQFGWVAAYASRVS